MYRNDWPYVRFMMMVSSTFRLQFDSIQSDNKIDATNDIVTFVDESQRFVCAVFHRIGDGGTLHDVVLYLEFFLLKTEMEITLEENISE